MPKIHFRLEMNWLTVLLFVNYLPNLHTERVIYGLRSLRGKRPNEIFDEDFCQYYLSTAPEENIAQKLSLTVLHRFNLTQQQQMKRIRKALSARSRFLVFSLWADYSSILLEDSFPLKPRTFSQNKPDLTY